MRFLLTLALVALCGPAGAQAILIPYGLAKQYGFCLYDFTTPNVLESTITWQDADIVVSQSGTEANAANAASSTVTDDGICFHHSLATTETDTAWINVLIRDNAGDVWFPINLRFETYGHPLSAHPTIGENVVTYGLAQSATATGIVLAAATSFTNGFLASNAISIISGTGAGQTRLIVTWTSTGDAAVIDRAWDTTPDSTSYYVVYREDQAFVAVNTSGRVEANLKECDDDATCGPIVEAFFEGTMAGITASCDAALKAAWQYGEWTNSGTGNLVTTFYDPVTSAARLVFQRSADTNTLTLTSFTCP